MMTSVTWAPISAPYTPPVGTLLARSRVAVLMVTVATVDSAQVSVAIFHDIYSTRSDFTMNGTSWRV